MPPAAAQQQRGPQVAPNQTHTQKHWKNLNLSDTRLSVEDDEVAALENMMYLGRSLQSVPLYGGSAGTALHTGSLVKTALGCSLTYGASTIPHPVVIVVFEDGSAWQRDLYLNGTLDSQVAPAGTFCSSAVGGTGITIWQDGPVLFLDDAAGYLKWSGTVLTVIDATKKGHVLAVFESHTWLLTAPRTITYTAPNTFDDFVAANGAGSFKITDDAFAGAVTHLQSTVEQLWILGTFAIDALGNVATSGGITTFAVTNAIATLGTSFGDSTSGYYRALTFYTGYSVHSLLGVTPQKLSAQLDRLFPLLGPAIASGPRSGVVELNGQTVLVFLTEFTDPVTGAASTKLLCFQEGKWWTATTPDLNAMRVLDLVTVTVGATPEVYGIDAGGYVYRVFARSDDTKQGTGRAQSGLSDLGEPLTAHHALRIGFDLSAPRASSVSRVAVTLATEKKATALDPEFVAFLPLADDRLGRRYALHRKDARIIGQRLGWAIEVSCADEICLEAAHWKVDRTSEWDIVDAAPAAFVWTNGGAFAWTNGGLPFTWMN